MYSCLGGEGGNGGNGKPGKSNLDKIPVNPANAQDVYNRGQQVDYSGELCSGIFLCHCDQYWYHALDITTNACGENGGNGGNGGAGAPAGSLILAEDSDIKAVNTRLKSTGGSPGSGGIGASGIKCSRHFTGYRHYHHVRVCPTKVSNSGDYEEFGGYGYTNNDQDCPGLSGVLGIPGINWES